MRIDGVKAWDNLLANGHGRWSNIVERFRRDLMSLAPTDAPYLTANPDVDAAVRRAEISSGYHHWIAHGQAEGRCLKP
jgi:hypothetical protein